MVPKKDLVSIITINYDSLTSTLELIESLSHSENRNFETIVIDNYSSDDPTPVLSKINGIRYFRSSKNLGFAGGNNLGIREAIGEYLLFVNNDTEFTPSLIDDLIETFKDNPNAGLISPKIVYYNTSIIQFAGYTEISNITGRNKALGNKEIDDDTYAGVVKTPYAHGAAMMTKRSVLDKSGYMPEIYFLYYEELDWCEQIKKVGFDILVNLNTHILHKESMSVGKNSPLKTYFLTRNRILFFLRNKDTLAKTVFLMYFFLLVTPMKSMVAAVKGEWRQLRAFWKGIIWHFIKSHE